jgi:NADH:ubiquinone oxidoreductase subunit 4 (subunit M)
LHGPVNEKWSNLADASNPWRKAPFVILLSCLIIFGCFPRLLTDKIQPRAQEIVDALNARRETAPAKSPIIQAAIPSEAKSE